jgi:putative ABC transport system permease protein
MKTFLHLEEVTVGFNPANLLTLSIALPDAKYPQPSDRLRFFRDLLERVAAIHGVQSSGVVTDLPFVGDSVEAVYIEGRAQAGEGFGCRYYGVSPGYFHAMGIPLLKGRLFNQHDDEQGAPVAIINERAAYKMFANQDPIGKRIWITNGPKLFREIVGEVGNTKQYRVDSEDVRQVYEPYDQAPASAMSLAIRTSGDPLSLANQVRNAVFSVDKDQPIAEVQTMEEILSGSVGPRRFPALLFGIFACLALALAAVGIYGVMAYSVGERIHEIGVRMALGAKHEDVLKLMLGQGCKLTLIGIGLGLAGTLGLTRFLASLLYGVQPTDPLTFAAASVLLAGVAFLASFIPARRAMRVDPMVALRYE